MVVFFVPHLLVAHIKHDILLIFEFDFHRTINNDIIVYSTVDHILSFVWHNHDYGHSLSLSLFVAWEGTNSSNYLTILYFDFL